MDRNQDQPPELPRVSSTPLPNRRLIAEQIATLLSHYWTTAEDQALRRAQASDWLADLEEFAPHIVTSSCAMWRRTESRRPTPADIRKLCLELQPPKKPIIRGRYGMRHLTNAPMTPDLVRDNWRSIPFPDLSEAEQKLFRESIGIVPHET